MVLGSMMLFDTDLPYMKVSLPVIIVFSSIIAGLFLLVLYAVWGTHMRKPFTGIQGMVDAIGDSTTDIKNRGTILVHGELWEAFSDSLIPANTRVKVIKVEGLKLKVEKFE